MPQLPDAGVVLFANDVRRLAAFYEAVTSMRRTHEEPGLIVLASPHSELILHSIPPQIAAQYPVATPPVVREDTAIKPFFRVASLAVARVAASLQGGALRPVADEWGARGFRACEAHDPEGNVIQFREDADTA
jgi:catechol 2,3-dioxygenase-like lactoylglutathione lyase family enzyme